MIDPQKAYKIILLTAKKKHKVFAKIVEEIGVIDETNFVDFCPVEFLSKSIVGQQLSNKAATTIWKRLIDLKNEHEKGSFPEVMTLIGSKKIQSCGISNRKVSYIGHLCSAAVEGRLNSNFIESCTYEELENILLPLSGIGPWTIKMFAIFFRRFPDVFSEEDAALNNAIAIISPNETSVDFAEHYTPFRSSLCRYLWKATDQKMLSKL